MKGFRKFAMAAMVAVLSIGMFAADVDARGGRSGGSSRSFSSSRSTPSRSSSRSVTKPKSAARPKAMRPKPAAKPKMTAKSAADKKSYETAKASGKAFSTKKAATADFKSKAKSDPKTQAALAKSYPTKYSKEPASRPAHVPQSYQGNTVIYQNGGYGYMGGGGFSPLMTYMLLDTMSDAMMANSMRSQGYHVGAAPTPQYAQPASSSWAGAVFVIILIVGGIVVFVYIANK